MISVLERIIIFSAGLGSISKRLSEKLFNIIIRISFFYSNLDITSIFRKNFPFYKIMLSADFFDPLTHKLFSKLLLDSEGVILKSLETLRTEIVYHPASFWPLPQTTLNLKQGDCKGFAILVGYYLNWLKIPFQIFTHLNIEENINGHVFVLFFFNNRFYFIDNYSGPFPMEMEKLSNKPKLEILSNLK